MYEKIKKIIARDGTREVVDSDAKELMDVTWYGNIPDFKDTSIICIKFSFSDTDSSDEAEETCWYINGIYADKFISSRENIYDEDVDEDYPLEQENYAPFKSENDIYCIFSDFIPEILLIEPPENYDMFEIFQHFYNQNMDKLAKASINESVDLFIEFMKEDIIR